MAGRKSYPKLPVPDVHRCNMTDAKGKRCVRQREYHVTKIDGSEDYLCTTCAFKLRDQVQANPRYFDNVRFVAINKLASAG
jgi:hypothetical protein